MKGAFKESYVGKRSHSLQIILTFVLVSGCEAGRNTYRAIHWRVQCPKRIARHTRKEHPQHWPTSSTEMPASSTPKRSHSCCLQLLHLPPLESFSHLSLSRRQAFRDDGISKLRSKFVKSGLGRMQKLWRLSIGCLLQAYPKLIHQVVRWLAKSTFTARAQKTHASLLSARKLKTSSRLMAYPEEQDWDVTPQSLSQSSKVDARQACIGAKHLSKGSYTSSKTISTVYKGAQRGRVRAMLTTISTDASFEASRQSCRHLSELIDCLHCSSKACESVRKTLFSERSEMDASVIGALPLTEPSIGGSDQQPCRSKFKGSLGLFSAIDLLLPYC